MRSDNKNTRLMHAALLAGVAAVLAAGPVTTATTAHASSLDDVMDADGGLIIPAYGWDSNWGQIIDAKEDNEDAEIIVIINPSSGPGGGKDGHWEDVIDDLQDEDIKVIGYVSTSWAGRSIGDVKDDVSRYYDWYEDIDGIFFDEQSASSDQVGYYEEIYEYTKDQPGSNIVVTNPGAPVPEGYIDTADIILVYESSGLPGDVTQGWMGDYDKNRFGVIPYGTSVSEGEYDDLHDQVGYVYVAPDASWMGVTSAVADQADWAGDD